MDYAMTEELAEETGVHIGDGSMNIYAPSNGACYTVACHHIDDKEYMNSCILPLIKTVYGLTPKPRAWSKGTYGFRIHSLEVVTFKHEVLHLPLGKKIDIRIPGAILECPSLMCSCIRGIADTDGSLYMGLKNGKLYPRIFITSTSEPLIVQIRDFLLLHGFRVQYWSHSQKQWRRIHKIAINGPSMLALWMRTIGFHNPKHLRKAQRFLGNTL